MGSSASRAAVAPQGASSPTTGGTSTAVPPGSDRPEWHAVQPWLSLLARLVIGGVFLYAGATKVGHVDQVVRAVRAFQVLPEALVHPVGYALPYLEVALGALVLLGLATRWVAVAVALLVVVYMAAIASASLRGLRIDCGCFSTGGELAANAPTHYLRDLARDALFLGVACFLAVRPRSPLSLDGLLAVPSVLYDDQPDDDED